MTRKLKIYSDAEYGNIFLPADIVEALGQHSHARQGNVYVWATTAKAAAARLDALGIDVRSPRSLRVVTHPAALMLDSAQDWPENTVLITRVSSGGPVVEVISAELVSERPYGVERTMRCIGELTYGTHFRPSGDLEPVVTDAMVDAALDALGVTMPDGVPHGWLIRNMRPALAAALKTQRTGP